MSFRPHLAKAFEREFRKFLKKDGILLKNLFLRDAFEVMVSFYDSYSYSCEADRADEALTFYSSHEHEIGLVAGFEYVYRPKTLEPDLTSFRLKLVGHYPTHDNLYGVRGSGLYYLDLSLNDWKRIRWGQTAAVDLHSVLAHTKVFQFLVDQTPKYFRVSVEPFYGNYH